MLEKITNNNFEITYETYGDGDEVLFAFHGYGRNADDFRILLPSLGKRYTIVSFNLLYTDGSFVKNNIINPVFTEADLKWLINSFLNKHTKTTFSLLAYSLGGKLALSCIELFPNQIKNIILIAPDGLKISFWYKVASNTWLGRKIYHYIIQHPWPFYLLAFIGKLLRLMPDKVYSFMLSQMDTVEKRQKAYDVWVVYRKITPDKGRIANIINTNKSSIVLFFGEFDKIIPPKIGISFTKRLQNKNALQILDAGHSLINSSINQKIDAFLLFN
jgi:pimeloyl-ACP methyl ester carboxylesterase